MPPRWRAGKRRELSQPSGRTRSRRRSTRPNATSHPPTMIARATALRGTLRDAQAECEAQGRVSDDGQRRADPRRLLPRDPAALLRRLRVRRADLLPRHDGDRARLPRDRLGAGADRRPPADPGEFSARRSGRTLRTGRRIPLSGGVQSAGARRAGRGRLSRHRLMALRLGLRSRHAPSSAARLVTGADGKPTAQVIQVAARRAISTASSTTGT